MYRAVDVAMDRQLRSALWMAGLIAIMLLGIPLGMLLRAAHRSRQERDRRLHLCPTCGYDLRGGHERCPECGQQAATANEGAAPAVEGRPRSLAELLAQAALEPQAEQLRGSPVPIELQPLVHAVERQVLETGRLEELPAAAIASLEAGLDGYYLRMLAGWTEANTLDLKRLVESAFREQGVEWPNRHVLLRRRALDVIDRFLDGRIAIGSLAGALTASLGEANVATPGSPAYILWVHASDWWDNESVWWRDMFEQSAREDALALRSRLLLAPVTDDATTWCGSIASCRSGGREVEGEPQ